PPADVAVPDDEHACGPCLQSETDAAVGGASCASAASSADDRGGHERDAVCLDRIAEHAPGGERILCAGENGLRVHSGLPFHRMQRGVLESLLSMVMADG